MSETVRAKIALAEAIVQAMWVKVLITLGILDERNQINDKNRESILLEANC